MGHKAVETTHINNAFGPWTANKCTVQCWLKGFFKGDESLEDQECCGRPSKVYDELRAITEVDPVKTTWEVAEELNTDHSMVIWHLKQTGKVEKLNKWVPHGLTKNKKNHHFEVSSLLILCSNDKRFLNQMCEDKWILYDNQWWPGQWMDLEETSKYFPMSNLHQK